MEVAARNMKDCSCSKRDKKKNSQFIELETYIPCYDATPVTHPAT